MEGQISGSRSGSGTKVLQANDNSDYMANDEDDIDEDRVQVEEEDWTRMRTIRKHGKSSKSLKTPRYSELRWVTNKSENLLSKEKRKDALTKIREDEHELLRGSEDSKFVIYRDLKNEGRKVVTL